MSNTKIKSSQFHGVIGHGTDGYFLVTNGDGSMSWIASVVNPVISSLSYPGSATAADPAGGETITITGTGFKTGATVTVGGTAAPSVSYVSATSLTITTPAKAAGDYDVVVTNTDGGTATSVNGISYNGIPSWTTAAGSLGTFASDTTISTITLQATEPDGGTITFSITNGALPTGLSLTGANIDGTTTLETADTLYTFTVTATDDETQTTPRTFTITVTKQFIGTENFTINTYTGNGSTLAVEGKIGTAAQFNGTNYIVTPELGDRTTFSYSFWMNMSNASSNDKYIFGEQVGGQIFATAGALIIYANAGDRTFSGSPTVSNNTWHHIVLSVSSGTGTIYVDGVDKGNCSYTNLSITAPLYMGTASTQPGNTTYAMQGKMDQVRIFNKAISSSEVTTLYGENNTSTTKSTTDIFDDGSGVALYEFEKGAKDTGGVNGYIGAGGIFNGSSSYINLGSASSLVPTNFTFSAWVKTTSTSTDFIVGTNVNPYYSKVAVRSEGDGRVRCFYGNYTSNENGFYSTFNTINNGEWHHIVYFINQTTAKLYIDGSLDTTHTLTITPTTNGDLTLATYYNDNNSSYGSAIWEGTLDQVRIFNKELSSSEVTTLYGETSASATKSTTDIFSDSSGIALYELEGNANDSGRFGSGAIDSGQSAVFNGSSSKIETSLTQTNTSAWSWSFWVNVSAKPSSGNIAAILSNMNGSSPFAGVAFLIDSPNFGFASGGSGIWTSNIVNPNLNQWYHIVITYDGTNTITPYVDGTSYGAITHTPANGNNLTIGDSDLSSWGSFNGKIDQVRIYSSALSASDVEALTSETNVPTTNLVADYKLDGDATDETGSYNGTATDLTYSDPAEFPVYDGTATNVSYAYDGTPTNVSFVGTSFQPDLVWIKERNNPIDHLLFDTIRGAGVYQRTNLTSNDPLPQLATLSSFDSNGFSVGTDGGVNGNNDTYVAWCWKAGGSAVSNTDGSVTSQVSANPDAGFSIVKYNSGTTAITAGHGLNQKPEMLICKPLVAGSWAIWHKDFADLEQTYIPFTTSAAIDAGVNIWNYSNWGNNLIGSVNPTMFGNNNDVIAYCFHSVDGYQKIGSYTSNASVKITTGFEPRWIMIKYTGAASDWWIMDTARYDGSTGTHGGKLVKPFLEANTSDAEASPTSGSVEFVSDGFYPTNFFNSNGVIYLAIA